MIIQEPDTILTTNPQYNASVIYNNYTILDKLTYAYNMDTNYKLFNTIKLNSYTLQETVNTIVSYAINDPCFGFHLLSSKLFWYNYNIFSPYINQIVNSIIYCINNRNTTLMEYITEGINSFGIRVQEILSRYILMNNVSLLNIDLALYVIKSVELSGLISDNTEHLLIDDINSILCESIIQEEPVNEPFYEGSILDFASTIISYFYDDVYTYASNIRNIQDLIYTILIKVACPILYKKHTMFDYGTDKWINEYVANTNPFDLNKTNYGEYLNGVPEYDSMSPAFKMLTTFIEHLCMLIITHIISSQPYSFDFDVSNPSVFVTRLTNYIYLMEKIMGVRS